MEMEPMTNETDNQPITSELPLKWYKFVIYFQLFASAALNIASCYRYISGDIYGSKEIAHQIYNIMPVIKICDLILGVIFFGLAFGAIVVRQKLYYKKADAVRYYLGYIIIQPALAIAYLLLVSFLVRGYSIDFTAMIPDLIGASVLYWANKKYFSRRSYLFVN